MRFLLCACAWLLLLACRSEVNQLSELKEIDQRIIDAVIPVPIGTEAALIFYETHLSSQRVCYLQKSDSNCCCYYLEEKEKSEKGRLVASYADEQTYRLRQLYLQQKACFKLDKFSYRGFWEKLKLEKSLSLKPQENAAAPSNYLARFALIEVVDKQHIFVENYFLEEKANLEHIPTRFLMLYDELNRFLRNESWERD